MLRRGASVVIVAGLVPLGVVVAALGALVHPATVRVIGIPVPVGLAVALAAEAAALVIGGSALGSRWGVAVPAAAWLLTVLAFSLRRPEGDLIVAANRAGYAFLLLGTVVAGVLMSLPIAAMTRAGADPAARTGRG